METVGGQPYKSNFNAVLRRSLDWRVKARIEDPQVLESASPDIEKEGVFLQDPDLQPFLTSGPEVAAGLQMQHSFEMQYNKEQCVDLIENYISWGGEEGLTEDTMRSACRLPPVERQRPTFQHAQVQGMSTSPLPQTSCLAHPTYVQVEGR